MSVFAYQFKVSFQQGKIHWPWIWGGLIGLIVSCVVFAAVFSYSYQDKIYQGILIDEVEVGGLTINEAQEKLLQRNKQNSSEIEVVLQVADSTNQIHQQTLTNEQVIQEKKIEAAIQHAFNRGRSGNSLTRGKVIISLLFEPLVIKTEPRLNQETILAAIKELKSKVDSEGRSPSLTLLTSGNPDTLALDPGQNGVELKTNQALQFFSANLLNYLESNSPWENKIELTIYLPTISVPLQLSSEEQELILQRAQNLVGRSIYLTPEIDEKVKETAVLLQNSVRKVNDQQLVELINLVEGVNKEAVVELVKTWAAEIDQPASNAQFEYNLDTLRATVFQPHQPGLKLNQTDAVETITTMIRKLEESAEVDEVAEDELEPPTQVEGKLHIEQAEPEITLAKTNNLGINELIGFGESYYRGSIATRKHNVDVATQKLNYTLVPPGETFSFNHTVGAVDGSTGFQQAYVIRSGQTLLEFGGGVCQVSTTMFRSLLDAGVNITRRLPHSYRVRYYELNNQPGFDATVYSGEVDLRFINDTPGYLLIIAESNATSAYMTVKIYGTSDGRHSEIADYKQWGYASPPPSQDIPDPSLAPGERQQVENAIPGLKTSFDWTVYDSQGEVLHHKTFVSHYQAWGAKFLVGI